MTDQTRENIQELVRALRSIKARDIMSTGVMMTRTNVKLADVAGTMSKARISGLPVMNEKDEFAGVITLSDLFSVMNMIMDGVAVENGTSGHSNPTVKFAMSTDCVSIGKDTDLYEIVELMSSREIHTLPVIENGKIIGIVGRRDVFKSFYDTVNKLDKK